MIVELDGAGAQTARYIRGINLIMSVTEGFVRKYYLYNAHGDVVQLTNESRNVVKSYDYDAFGVEKNQDPADTNVWRYSGEYFDKETGLQYLRARYYDPIAGRFTTEDSVWGLKQKFLNGKEFDDPLSLNLYTYCHNDPIEFVDPSGQSVVRILYPILMPLVDKADKIATYAINAAITGVVAVTGYVVGDSVGRNISEAKKTEVPSKLKDKKTGKVKTPDTHPGEFSKKDGTYKHKDTG